MASSIIQKIYTAASVVEQKVAVTTVETRLVIVALALLILFIRMPFTFVRPEFWAEDGLLISDAYNNGWASLTQPLGGIYLNFYGSLVANIAVQFSAHWWPWISIYGAHFAALLTVFLVTSSRFDLPYKAIAALAAVATPASRDSILGALANAQWVLPLGLVVLLFSRASRTWFVLLLEMIFVGVVALEGPLGIFLVPMFIYRSWATKSEERNRLMALTAILIVGSAIQSIFVAKKLGVFDLVQPHEYDPLLWITIPLRWLDAVRFLVDLVGHSLLGAIVVIVAGVGLVWFSLQRPYRTLKITMLIFASAILYSGMFKYRADLNFKGNDRYVYIGSVFFFWFLCIWATSARNLRSIVVGTAMILIIAGVARRANDHRANAQMPWSHFEARVGTGPISIPIAPYDAWKVTLTR